VKVFVVIALLLASLAAYGCVSQNAPPTIVGNDSDVHGCIASAGYSWCGLKQKCLRSWEENCTNIAAPQACTMEAKLCPDGSAVGRTGPNCEFAPCPQANATIAPANYTLYGKITIGPLCAVEPCSRVFDYSVARVNVYDASNRGLVARASAGSGGYYGVNLGPGSYLVNVTDASGNSFGLPSLDYTQAFSIEKGHVIQMDFDIDTGIR